MSSIRKWLASKVFPSVLSNDGQLNESTSSDGLSLFGSYSHGSSVDSMLRTGSSTEMAPDLNSENQSYFSVIYHHYKSRIRQNAPINEKVLITYMYQFYQANEELNSISYELDTFDGRKDTDRCSALVNSLRIAQDRVMTLIFKIMDEIGCQRASREYRLKFPDELLTGEGIESLNSQIWFGAECLSNGSTITNNQDKSNYLRPIAANLTTTLDHIRYELRSCCNYLPKNLRISKDLIKKLENFDNLFSSFEYDYVKAMLQIKTCEDIENLQELTFLFSDTLAYALKKGLISKEDVDGCQPSVMIALPRLSIVRGLLQGYGSVVCKLNQDELTSILKPYHSLLLEFHEFLMILSEDEIFFLEKLLSTNHDNMDLSDNDPSLPLVETVNNNQDSLLTVFNKFFKHAKRMKDSNRSHKKSIQGKPMMNRYISASVDFLLINNRNDQNEESHNKDNRYIPFKSNEILFRFNSLPNINFCSTKCEKTQKNEFELNRNGLRSRNLSNVSPDSYSSTNSSAATSSSSCPSVSLTCSSSSSISVELDFLKQFKDMLKRTQLKTYTKNRNTNEIRSTSSGFYNSNSNPATNEMNPRAKTAFTDVKVVDFLNEFKPNSVFTPTTSAFSNNSIHFDLDAFFTDDISQLTLYTKKILHQVFVMISRIADEFQTNYASELRNILRTVFLFQEMEDEKISNALDQSSMIQSVVDVQMGRFDENDSIDKEVEEAIDANEYLCRENFSFGNFPSTSCSSSHEVHPTITDQSNGCDNSMNVDHYMRSSSLENVSPQESSDHVPFNNCVPFSSSCPLVGQQGSANSLNMEDSKSGAQNGVSYNGESMHLRKSSNVSIESSNSSNSLILQSSQVTSSSATTIDEANRGEPLPFIFSTSTSNSSPALSSPMIPILGTVSGPSSSATNLLLPPIWIPDDSVTTCKSCTQAFNLIRRRHHCRRCGQIFCHQCSNNFVSLKCFGYAKPVRVCNICLELQEKSERNGPQVPHTNFGAS